MRFTLFSARKDLRRLARDPVSLLMWMGIPVFVGALLLIVFGGKPAQPHGVLLVADDDGSFLSKAVATAFTQDKLGEMFTVERVARAEGRRRMARGEASALLIIPAGFGVAALGGERCELRLVTNPSQRILPQIVEETASLLAEAAFYLNQIAGDQLRLFAQPPPGGAATYSDASVAAVSTAINRLFANANRYINPPVLKLETGAAKKEPAASGPNIPALFFPSMLSMTILFAAQGLSGDFWNERNAGTLRRLAATAAPLGRWLAGKLLALVFVFVLAGAAGLACARWLLDLPVANPAFALLWVVASGVTLYLFFALLQMFAASERSGNLLVNFCFFPIAMLGGIFFPFEMMPAWMAAVARRTPIGWALAELRALLAGPAPFAMPLLILGAAALTLYLVSWWRLKRSFAR